MPAKFNTIRSRRLTISLTESDKQALEAMAWYLGWNPATMVASMVRSELHRDSELVSRAKAAQANRDKPPKAGLRWQAD